MTGSGTEETVNQMAHLATEGAVGHDIYLPIAAVFVAALSFVATVLIHRRERRAHEAQQAIERWNDVLSICAEKPIYLDANFSTEYSKASSAERFTYDAFNYKAWSLVDYIIDRGLYREIQFRSMVYWICAHSRNWLDENPFLFGSNMFWHVILNVSKEPLTLFKSRTLPLTSGSSIKNNTDRYADQVDWDEVSEHYDDFIIGPFADEMVRPDPLAHNAVRNKLLTYLEEFPPGDLREMRIADYGCGPGNLIKHLSGKIDSIVGIDLSDRALSIAAKRADEVGVKFTAVKADMNEYIPDQRFDIIISVNSILPPNRNEILQMLQKIRQGLSPVGVFAAILASYDTTERLVEYWREHYTELSSSNSYLGQCMSALGRRNSKVYVDQCVSAFKRKKKLNPDDKSFADDNIHSQCFHTPETIRAEFASAGLEIIRGPEKIYYPWSITEKFDYGFFPGKEEIWDWFVVAKRANTKRV